MFNVRKWLNGKRSASTGSVVAYSGPAPWKKDKMMILEISDCHNKVRLHKADVDSTKDFIKKLRRLRSVIDNFISYLERNEK